MLSTKSRRASNIGLALAAGVIALCLIPPAGLAQGGLESRLGAGVEVTRQDETAKVGFIGTANGAAIEVGLPPSTPAAKVAETFIDEHAKSFGLAGEGASLQATATGDAAGDGTTVRLQQYHNGLPVLGGELVVNLDSGGDVLSVLGETSPSPDVAATPSVSADEAVDAALGVVGRAHDVSPDSLTADRPTLQVYDPRLLDAPSPLQEARTAWVLEVSNGDSPMVIDELVVVDAEFGAVTLHFNQVETAKNRSVCDADATEFQYPCTNPVWTEVSQQGGVDADVAPAFNFAGDTYDFFFTRFGRDSLDGAGLELKSTVDYCPSFAACPYANAFWDGSQMVYGDGYAAGDDVVGHELAHGFTEFTSHLFYYQQSGAINESMSDVFGEFVDQTNAAGTDTTAVKWDLGEDVPGGTIRDMANPPAFGDPDRMQSPNYTADTGEGDGGGVHSNSGVNNKAAFLITDGATFNGQAVTGIGLTKAARIYYEVETAMLVSGSDYADLGNALNQACTNLIGTVGITAANCTQVGKAVLATEMASGPANSPTVTAPTCTSGSVVNTYFDNLENPASGSWSSAALIGLNSWFYPQNPNPILDSTYATSGSTNFWGYDRATISDSFIRMASPVAIPPSAFMRFDHAFGFEDDAAGAYDGGVVEYSTTGAGGPWTDAGPLFDSASGYNGTIAGGSGNPLAGRSAFVRESNGYGASRLNLSSLAGQNVSFRFRIGSDSVLDDYGWFIDDVRIYTCTEPPFTDATPPDTRIDSRPKAKTSKRRATFTFSSTEPDASFECAINKRAFAACPTPKRVRVKRGKHRFLVRATDAAGNVDPTPAKDAWKVKKKRRKK